MTGLSRKKRTPNIHKMLLPFTTMVEKIEDINEKLVNVNRKSLQASLNSEVS